jgi:hypothetical protein
MESKRKKRRVVKAVSATPAPQKSEAPRPKSPEALIRYNGELVETLFESEPWREIAFPLIQESIASVSGRFTNGRFYQGSLTRSKMNRDELAGYQLALEEFHNRLHDFVVAKRDLIEKKKQEAESKKAEIYNPYLEEFHEETESEESDRED